MEMNTNQYLTEKQVASITGISIATLQNQRYMRSGMKYHKIGRSVRYSLEEIHRYMQAHAIDPNN